MFTVSGVSGGASIFLMALWGVSGIEAQSTTASQTPSTIPSGYGPLPPIPPKYCYSYSSTRFCVFDQTTATESAPPEVTDPPEFLDEEDVITWGKPFSTKAFTEVIWVVKTVTRYVDSDSAAATEFPLPDEPDPTSAASISTPTASAIETSGFNTVSRFGVFGDSCTDSKKTYNDSTVVKIGSTEFEVQCATDFVGGSESKSPSVTESFDACLELCLQQQSCIAVSWEKHPQDTSSGDCHFKAELKQAQADNQFISAYKVVVDPSSDDASPSLPISLIETSISTEGSASITLSVHTPSDLSFASPIGTFGPTPVTNSSIVAFSNSSSLSPTFTSTLFNSSLVTATPLHSETPTPASIPESLESVSNSTAQSSTIPSVSFLQTGVRPTGVSLSTASPSSSNGNGTSTWTWPQISGSSVSRTTMISGNATTTPPPSASCTGSTGDEKTTSVTDEDCILAMPCKESPHNDETIYLTKSNTSKPSRPCTKQSKGKGTASSAEHHQSKSWPCKKHHQGHKTATSAPVQGSSSATGSQKWHKPAYTRTIPVDVPAITVTKTKTKTIAAETKTVFVTRPGWTHTVTVKSAHTVAVTTPGAGQTKTHNYPRPGKTETVTQVSKETVYHTVTTTVYPKSAGTGPINKSSVQTPGGVSKPDDQNGVSTPSSTSATPGAYSTAAGPISSTPSASPSVPVLTGLPKPTTSGWKPPFYRSGAAELRGSTLSTFIVAFAVLTGIL